jgi:hypothetical protein
VKRAMCLLRAWRLNRPHGSLRELESEVAREPLRERTLRIRMTRAAHNRGHVEFVHAPEIEPVEGPGDNWPVGAQVKMLSQDRGSGALTGVLILPPGYRRKEGHLLADSEFFVLRGSLWIGETLHGFGFYSYAPAGATQAEWTVNEACELLFMARTGSPDFVPERGPNGADARSIEIDTERVSWSAGTRPDFSDPFPGLAIKVLRHVEETGENLLLFAAVPRFYRAGLEFHSCVQENYLVEGDLWLSNAGQMKPGSYLWRLPYTAHGPFWSRTGAVFLGWDEFTRDYYFSDDPRRTPDENRRQAESERHNPQRAG